jgi:subtilisin family serine protease
MSLLPFGSVLPPTDDAIPEYHPGLLEVKLRTDVGVAALERAGLAGPVMLTREFAARTTGLGALLAYERSGLIRRVTPIPESAAPGVGAGETPLLASFAAAISPAPADEAAAGVALVELHDDSDTSRLEGELRADPTVESVARVPVRYLCGKARKPKAGGGATPAAAAPGASALWNLTRIRWTQARAKAGFKDATTIKVAVLDTGIDPNHPDLAGVVAGYEFAHPTTAAASSNRDVIGHGTHVAGTVAARINNRVGVNGVCTCQLYAYKIFDDVPDWNGGYFAYYVDPVMYQRALSRCLSLRADVVNLSIGGRGAPSPNESQLFARLIAAGTTVVAAMGNENSQIPSYPAAIPGVIAVGATRIDDRRSSFSNYGPHIALCAPGSGIWSTLPTYAGNQGYYPIAGFPPRPDLARPLPRDTDYAAWDGTSMASPHVAGAAALYLAKKGRTAPAAVKQALMKAAVKVPDMQGQAFTPFYGAGRLDLVNLL